MPSKVWFDAANQKRKAQDYPCLCEAISPVLFWNRVLGIFPAIALKLPSHVSSCKFGVSKWWMIYSYILQGLYIPFSVTAAVLRMSCGPNSTNHQSSGSDWYVMTFGYFIADVDTAIALIVGVANAEKTCKTLEQLAFNPGPIGELRRLRKNVKIAMGLILAGFATVFFSFTYVAWMRSKLQSQLDVVCHMLDKPIGVMIRGSTLLVPGVQMALIMVLCLLVSTKFQRLADKTILTLEANVESLQPDCEITATIEQNIPSATNLGVISFFCTLIFFVIEQLNQLAETHRKATSCLKQINKCVGLQVLAEVTTNLYTIVYYLYRYSTASHETIASNVREKGHYVIALIYRIFKLIIYISLGHLVTTSSNKPLEALQRARIINLSTRLQQQVQTLILQWSGKNMALSAFGIVNVGPWLVAPIVGNVITYLLVALQFERPTVNNLSPNVTAILETIF